METKEAMPGDNMREVTRVTVTLPLYLWEAVKRTIPTGRRSRFLAEALERELHRRKRMQQLGQLREFQKRMFQKYGELPSRTDDIQLTQKKSDDNQDSLY
ncbi:MAG: hypothetical protein NTW32_22115 [Chloroflexi bacterium]|nr:hypothetical protein [Chloroflexota bacterium]